MYQLASQTMFSATHPERGCFFLGRELGHDTNQIYIDEYTTDFSGTDGYFEGGGLDYNNVINSSRKWHKVNY